VGYNGDPVKIALSGTSGSGKGTVAKILVEQHNFVRASTGDICRQISQLLYGNEDKKNLNSISAAINQIDNSIFINAALRNIKNDKIVFDSIRYRSDMLTLKKLGFVIWRVEASIDIRKDRLKGRAQVIVEDDFYHASEIELDDCIFDATILNNNNDMAILCNQVNEMIDK